MLLTRAELPDDVIADTIILILIIQSVTHHSIYAIYWRIYLAYLQEALYKRDLFSALVYIQEAL